MKIDYINKVFNSFLPEACSVQDIYGVCYLIQWNGPEKLKLIGDSIMSKPNIDYTTKVLFMNYINSWLSVYGITRDKTFFTSANISFGDISFRPSEVLALAKMMIFAFQKIADTYAIDDEKSMIPENIAKALRIALNQFGVDENVVCNDNKIYIFKHFKE